MNNEKYKYPLVAHGAVGGNADAQGGIVYASNTDVHYAGAMGGSNRYITHRADGRCCNTGEPELTDEVLFGLHGTEDEEEQFNTKLRRLSRRFIAVGLVLILLSLLGIVAVAMVIA